MTFFVAVLFVAVAVAMAASLVQHHYDLDSITYVPSEIFGRVFALPGAGPAGLRRRYVRSVTAEKVVMPSKRTLAVDMLAVTVGERDLERLCPTGDLDELARDTATTYDRHARRRGWERDKKAATRVFLLVDPTRQAGWTPRSHLVTEVAVDAVGDSARAAGPAAGAGAVTAAIQDLDASDALAVRTIGITTQYQPHVQKAELRAEAAGTSVMLHTSPIVVGREDLDVSGVSRRHASFELRGGSWFVRDAGSSNGTFVDGARLATGEEREVATQTVIKFGPGSPDFVLSRPGEEH